MGAVIDKPAAEGKVKLGGRGRMEEAGQQIRVAKAPWWEPKMGVLGGYKGGEGEEGARRTVPENSAPAIL